MERHQICSTKKIVQPLIVIPPCICQILFLIRLITTRMHSFQEVNVFSHVCLFTGEGGLYTHNAIGQSSSLPHRVPVHMDLFKFVHLGHPVYVAHIYLLACGRLAFNCKAFLLDAVLWRISDSYFLDTGVARLLVVHGDIDNVRNSWIYIGASVAKLQWMLVGPCKINLFWIIYKWPL